MTEALTSTHVPAMQVLITIAPLKALGLDAPANVNAISALDHRQMNRCVARLIVTDASLGTQSGPLTGLAGLALINFMAGMVLLEASSCLISRTALAVENQCDQTDHLPLFHHQGLTCPIDRSGFPMNGGLPASTNHLVLKIFREALAMTVGLI